MSDSCFEGLLPQLLSTLVVEVVRGLQITLAALEHSSFESEPLQDRLRQPIVAKRVLRLGPSEAE